MIINTSHLQRGRGHQRADPERGLHVPAPSVEGDHQPGHRPHLQPLAGTHCKCAWEEKGFVTSVHYLIDLFDWTEIFVC